MSISNINKKFYNFGSNLVGNRVFDLYLKYNGIKLLTSATLVPLALILGKDLFEKYVVDQKGGYSIPENITGIDDPLVGTYLKLSGLTTLYSITPHTLIPVGVLMVLYDLYLENQKNNKTNSQSGGGKDEIIDYAKNIWGNRILDLFVKYQGLKTLTSATLVPFALILSKDLLENALIKKQQKGGGSKIKIPENVAVIDDPLLGNYLKLSGIDALSLTSETLIPLGLAVLLYHLYINH